MSDKAKAQLTPTGVLRAGINLSNFLLVTGRSANGDPEGVSPDMARAIAGKLGVPLKLVPFKTPGELGDAVEIGGHIVTVEALDGRRVHRVRVRRKGSTRGQA